MVKLDWKFTAFEGEEDATSVLIKQSGIFNAKQLTIKTTEGFIAPASIKVKLTGSWVNI